MISAEALQKTSVVIPTYNEGENIQKLVEAINEVSPEISIIIVDDASPDGTGDIAESLKNKYPKLKVIHREKKNGRGGACIEGFKVALNTGSEYIFEMDADFSHNPQDIPRFIQKIKEGSDLVIGSRRMKGSKILEWGIKRTVFSTLANTYARLVLGIPISDYTNGYRCYSREALEALDYKIIESKGYIVLSEMAYQLYLKGFKITEIPTVFLNRQRGLSNFGAQEIKSAFIGILLLRERSKGVGVASEE